jgi:hypothetical protein
MVIIDLKTLIMGVAMGFLAFLVIGGGSSLASWIFYPVKRPIKVISKQFLFVFLLGVIAAGATSYLGQWFELIHSGQMLEWLCAIFAAIFVGIIYSLVLK